MSTTRRLTTGLAVTGLLAAGLFGATAVTGAGTAQARCNGQGAEVVSDFSVWTVQLVAEFPKPDTCNGNNTYQGFLVDRRADGGEVSVLVQTVPNGNWIQEQRHHEAVDVWVPYAFEDRNNNSHANMKLCANTSIGGTMVCGWGGVVNGNGDNIGF
jgi:hypothetical protein